jgi:Transposase
MTEAYDGRQVVGIDLHRRRSVIVRMTEDGRKLETVRITNSPAALRREIAKAGKHPRVVLEATYGWYWAADVLEAAGAEVHLAHPLGVKAYSYRRVKTSETRQTWRTCCGRADCPRRSSPRRRSVSCANSAATGTSWSSSAPPARIRCTGCWPSSASRCRAATSSACGAAPG